MMQKPCINLSHKCNLLRITLQVKQQVSVAVVCRLQFLNISYTPEENISVFESLRLLLYLKETWIQVFFCEIYKISKNNFFSRTATVAASEF